MGVLGGGGESRNTPGCFMLLKLEISASQPDGPLGLYVDFS